MIFRRLLLYLYGAPVDKTVGAESICELMLLADRFSLDVLKVKLEIMNTDDDPPFKFQFCSFRIFVRQR